MIALIRQIRRHSLGLAALVYAGASLALLALAWGVMVELGGMSGLYIRLLAVFALLGMPTAVGLAWAIREPFDRSGKGHVVREE